MKINMPVTDREVEVTNAHSIVSMTDLKGQITYVNHDFIEISGFTEAELIGQSHNIVRHPDMPQEAFADLWRTLKDGRPWTGYVKNRCKNGDYYWVQANATPVREGGQVVGYMSVRSSVDRQTIQEVSRAYQSFRDGSAKGLSIRDGKVVKAGFSLSHFLSSTSLRKKMFSLVGVLGLFMMLMSGVGMMNMQGFDAHVQHLYQQRLVPLKKLKTAADMYAVNIVDTAHQTRNGNFSFSQGLGNIEMAEKRIAEAWGEYTKTEHGGREGALVGEAASLMQNANMAVQELKRIMRNQDQAALAQFTISSLYPAIDPVSGKVGELVDLQIEQASQEIEEAMASGDFMVGLMLTVMVIGLLVAVVAAIMLVRMVIRPVETVHRALLEMSTGKLDTAIDSSRKDELGLILSAAKSMQIKVGFDMSEARRAAEETLRIKIGLDNVATNVMIADRDLNIIYMNKAIGEMFRFAESAIQQDLPNFSAAKLMGANIDVFHKDPSHQRAMLAKLTQTHRATIKMGGRTFSLTVTPVMDEKGARLGTAVEWVDRTAEVAVEEEVASLVEAAANGDFEQRIPEQDKQGFFLKLSKGLNGLMGVISAGLTDVAAVLNCVARGDLTTTITADYAGTFAQLKEDTNTTVERLREVVGRIKESTEAINTAASEISAGNTDLSRRTEEQASSLEETASSMEELNATVRQNADSASEANSLAHKSNRVAESGGEKMVEVVDTMNAIRESSKKISDIIVVIDSIAFQTNILALNAAVEAARAGEQGRGFAVVASEVRGLAQRSAQAAKEIKLLISDSTDKVESGVSLVDEAGKTMEEIVSNFKRLTALVTDISDASQEQSEGIGQVTHAVAQMDEVTQQNAALVEQAAAAAESLEDQAQSLVHAVSIFRLSESDRVGGGESAAAAPKEVASSKVSNFPVRPAAAKKPKHDVAAPLPKVKRASGMDSDDEWEEF